MDNAEEERMKTNKVSTLRIDSGREYKNEDLMNWYRKKGIGFAVPYSTERHNTTEKIRALLFDSGISG